MELVAEIGAANGDLQWALDACAAAKEVGFDWIKGQIYDRDRLVTRTASTYAQVGVKVPSTQYEDFESQLSYDEWAEVKVYCETIGIGWFASVFDEQAVEFCESLGVERYKIASGDITHKPLIELVASTHKHVILSTGAATEDEVQRAVSWVDHGNLSLLACTLSYPTQMADAHLNRMERLRALSEGSVGYSDHTFGTGAIVRAKHLGANLLEKHFTITPGAGGDHDFAVTPAQMRNITWDTGLPVYDGDPTLQPGWTEMRARTGARRSAFAAHDLVQGSIVFPDDVVMLRPGGGIEPWAMEEFYGRVLKEDLPYGVAFNENMF